MATEQENQDRHPAPGEATSQLLQRIMTRQRWAAIGSRGYRIFLVAATLFALLLLVSRLLGIIPDVFAPAALLVVPAVAAIGGMIFHRRVSEVDAARVADEKAATKDLFLTSALIEKAPGEYKDIVLRDAEKKAADVAPEKVVPFQWVPPLRNSVAVLALLIVGILFLP